MYESEQVFWGLSSKNSSRLVSRLQYKMKHIGKWFQKCLLLWFSLKVDNYMLEKVTTLPKFYFFTTFCFHFPWMPLADLSNRIPNAIAFRLLSHQKWLPSYQTRNQFLAIVPNIKQLVAFLSKLKWLTLWFSTGQKLYTVRFCYEKLGLFHKDQTEEVLHFLTIAVH